MHGGNIMYIEYTNIGETIRALRKANRMTKAELSEKVGISESHISKIETGVRRPGINTYQKIMELFGADLVVRSKEDSIKEKCAAKAQHIVLNSTDTQALFMIKMLESIAKNIEVVL